MGIIGLILVLLVIWIALNVIGGLLGPGGNGLLLGVIVLVAILWFFDYI